MIKYIIFISRKLYFKYLGHLVSILQMKMKLEPCVPSSVNNSSNDIFKKKIFVEPSEPSSGNI